ncbi:MAG: ABC transporter ATP-binding protein [Chloroflexi bacterium]|nr:ABC transporter ATP-binding protein [Chloroflexota bacterium]
MSAETHANGGHSAALDVNDLGVSYYTSSGEIKAADGVSFSIMPGKRMGLVGESGSGKTTTALALMRLIKPPGRITKGSAVIDGIDLLSLSEEEMRTAKLSQIALVPQGAMNSLNPVAKVKNQIIDGLRDHDAQHSASQYRELVTELLDKVGLNRQVGDMYPHELSGGMKQRVTIAIAISMGPKVIIADEPTSALDVVVQRQIMETLAELQDELAAAILLIGHDIGLMAQFVDTLGVMYAGRLVETGTLRQLLSEPKHPYTQMLIDSLPSLERKDRKRGDLRGIPGTAPSLYALPSGCPFHPRCPQAMDICPSEEPLLKVVNDDHVANQGEQQAACLLY